MGRGYFEYFCNNTSLHGFRFLPAADDPVVRKSLKRIFWTSCIAVSYFYLTSTLASTINEFSSKSTSVNIDASFRDWNNTFPAVSICLSKGSTTKLTKYMDAIWAQSGISLPRVERTRLTRSIQHLLFMSYDQPLDGINVPACTKYNETCGVNLGIVKRALIPYECNQIMKSVKFLGKDIDCEKYFKLYKTEFGECFIANSLYSSKPLLNTFDHLPLHYSNLENYERSLEIEYFHDDFIILKAFIHSPEELPFNLIHMFRIKKAPASTYIAINVVETINEKSVEEQPISSRNCRFPEEYVIEGELGYSLSTCKFSRQMKEELKECNCTLPMGPVPKNTPICIVTDFECVVEKTRFEASNALSNDPCQVPTCVGMEIITIGSFEEDVNGDAEDVAVFKIEILNKPNSRYIRRVSITRLDMTGEIKFQQTSGIQFCLRSSSGRHRGTFHRRINSDSRGNHFSRLRHLQAATGDEQGEKNCATLQEMNCCVKHATNDR